MVTEDVIWNFSIFCSGLHFVQWSRTIWAILVVDRPRNNPSFVEIPEEVMEELLFKFFFFYFQLWSSFYAARRNTLSNFGWGPPKELSYKIWLKYAQWLPRTCCLKFFSVFSSGGHFVQQSRNIWAISVEDLPRNNPIEFGWNLPCNGGDVVWSFFLFLALAAILCSRAERFEQFW